VENENALFEQTILPHLDAAFNLARWLVRNEPDARDLVQESCLRAFKSFARFRGGDARCWLLTIVRNAAYTALRKRGTHEQVLDSEVLDSIADPAPNAEQILERAGNIEAVRAAIAQLPNDFREVIVLREMENFSYKEIADTVGVPVGTVMSRLARARRALQEFLIGGLVQ
jgi:RNA polymerase sigma-70 factor (ECF subfamily)